MQGRISDLVPRAAARFGDAPAFTVLGGATTSFAAIERQVAGFAGWMAAQGICRQDRVALYLPNGLDWIVAYHAIARLGAVVVPANFLLTPHEVAFMLADADARALILPTGRRAGELADAALPPDLLIVAVEPASGRSALPSADPVEPADVAPDDLFTLCYTSGTTGRPKGAMLSHANIFASTAHSATIHVRTRGETVLSALPFPHVYGNIVMNAAFLVGMRLVAMERFEAGAVLAAIAQERPALFEGVPTMFYQMLAHPAAAATDFSSLARCTVGGQTMPVSKIAEVAERFGCPVCELWGMTEVSGPATSHSPYWTPRHGTIGLPFPSVELRVADLDDRTRDMPDGEAGELCVRGPLVTRGYWRNPQATAETIDAHGWLATGDIGLREPDGYFRIIDRRKDLIITGGYNIYPAEVEEVLATHPAVAMSAVASLPDEEKGEIAKAFVVLRSGIACDATDLAAHCRRSLAAYKVPRAFAFVDDLPKTSTGKILRRALRGIADPTPATCPSPAT